MKNFLFVALVFLMANTVSAQAVKKQSIANKTISVEKKQHRIVFQVTSEDTLVQKSLMKQLKNITSVSPGTKIEVVCHGPGLYMLVKEKTILGEQIKQYAAKGIQFVACEFAMAERKVTKEQLLAEVSTVQSGLLEIVSRQEQGWSYIKSGF